MAVSTTPPSPLSPPPHSQQIQALHLAHPPPLAHLTPSPNHLPGHLPNNLPRPPGLAASLLRPHASFRSLVFLCLPLPKCRLLPPTCPLLRPLLWRNISSQL